MSQQNQTHQIKIGSRVQYRGAWGSEPAQAGIITGHGEKHGRIVYDVVLDNGSVRWGYAEQFMVEGSFP